MYSVSAWLEAFDGKDKSDQIKITSGSKYTSSSSFPYCIFEVFQVCLATFSWWQMSLEGREKGGVSIYWAPTMYEVLSIWSSPQLSGTYLPSFYNWRKWGKQMLNDVPRGHTTSVFYWIWASVFLNPNLATFIKN